MKKLVPMLLIVVIVFNFILSGTVYADLDDVSRDLSRYGGNGTIKGEAAQQYIDEGKSSSGTTMSLGNFGQSLIGLVFQMFASLVNVFPITLQNILSMFTAPPGESGEVDASTAFFSMIGANPYHFTIERTVFNEIPIFNINVFNQDSTYTVAAGEHEETFNQHNINLKLKESVTGWFYTIRLIATMINLCILIYVGIKMATSSIASEEAKYKKMLVWWVESMIILFLLHYIMYAMFYIGDMILDIINILRFDAIASGGAVSFEDMVINKICMAMLVNNGTGFFLYSMTFWFLTFLQIKFFFTYMKRTFTVMFLVVISPLITVTFPIDKLDNGKAEAFEKWFKELLINTVIQPIHAIVYLVFVYLAGKIAQQAPMVAMVFLLSLGRIENIVRNVFQITDSVTNVNSAVKGGKGPGFRGALKMFMKKSGAGE